ncbi:MAG: hypothetical protein F6K19_47005 [Cyanothece sp. SIO1E1]|nr:hypothetical protein [Cyanothece sp. SIO1E1]
MSKREVQISEAKPEQKGSFCDVASGHEYQNTDNLGAQLEVNRAIASNETPWEIDSAEAGEAYSIDQRFNIFRTEADGQGSQVPRKYAPGW